MGKRNIKAAEIVGRLFDLVVPKGSLTSERKAVLDRVRDYARKLQPPVEIEVNEY